MSADWFCKIGEKKVGPLNGQQLKTIVAKGQLKPEHLVRRGSEGPWVPAGRIKGLFVEGPTGTAQPQGKTRPPATAKPLPKAARKPGVPPAAKAASLPTAAEAPAPPAADIPPEASGGHHKHHVQMNLDSLHIESTPVAVSRRKVRAGLQGMKKDERKKLTIILMCLIGGGMTIGLIVFTWAFASGKFSPKHEEAKDPLGMSKTADSSKKTEEKPADKKPAEKKETEISAKVSFETLVGNVAVMVLKPTRGAPPKGAKTGESDVLTVPVRLNLKSGKATQVELTSWADESLKSKVSLKDDQKSYELLEQVADKESDGKTITEKWTKVYLVFQAPTSKNLKSLQLRLPASAFHVDGTVICCEIKPNVIQSDSAKTAPADKADKPAKAEESDAEENTPKSDKKKPGKAKAAKTDEGETTDSAPMNDKKKPDKAKAVEADDGDNVMPPKEP